MSTYFKGILVGIGFSGMFVVGFLVIQDIHQTYTSAWYDQVDTNTQEVIAFDVLFEDSILDAARVAESFDQYESVIADESSPSEDVHEDGIPVPTPPQEEVEEPIPVPVGEKSLHLISSQQTYRREADDSSQLWFNIMFENLSEAICDFDIRDSTKSIYREESFRIHSDPILVMSSLPADTYTGYATCRMDGDVYTDELSVDLIITPGSICDDANFSLAGQQFSFENAKALFHGEWVGCGDSPWKKPFQVAFTFRDDGTYNSRNIELVANPDTLRIGAALYYVGDGDAPTKRFEILDQNASGYLTGEIYTSTLDEIRNVKFSADGNTMYFEVIHLDRYGPMVYILQRK
jgi:hypothetical protein